MPSTAEREPRAALPGPARPPLDQPDESDRMPLSAHLEELRGCVVRSLIALVVACLACIWPARYLLEFIARPVVLVLRRYGQPESLLTTGPAEGLLVYIRVVVFCGFLLASPYILMQAWRFVASGLYINERRWVLRLLPASIGLFLAGVAFMYTLVLMVSLNFLVGFAGWIPLPQGEANSLERALLGIAPPARTDAPSTGAAQSESAQPQAAQSQPAASAPATTAPAPFAPADRPPGRGPTVTFLRSDPPAPVHGEFWFNVTESRFKLRGPAETFSVQLAPDAGRGLYSTHFRLSEYLSFVMVLTLAFGLAFQTPLVVLFLARSGIVSVSSMRKYRRVVIFIIVVIAGMISPPDLMSHLLLSIPMIGLFELGLLIAARSGDRQQQA